MLLGLYPPSQLSLGVDRATDLGWKVPLEGWVQIALFIGHMEGRSAQPRSWVGRNSSGSRGDKSNAHVKEGRVESID